jgi:hypothetical protein
MPAAILVACIWLTNYLVRRFLPTIWETIANIPFGGGIHRPAVELARKAWQALPSVATGALLAAISTGNATDAVVGAILGLIAPVWHEALKALPVPYRGGKPPATTPPLVVEDPPIPLPPNPAPSMFALRDEITSVEQPIPQRPSDRPPKP